jgi:hypothetical protein
MKNRENIWPCSMEPQRPTYNGVWPGSPKEFHAYTKYVNEVTICRQLIHYIIQGEHKVKKMGKDFMLTL